MTLLISTGHAVQKTAVDVAARSGRGVAYLMTSRFSGMAVGLLSSAIMGRLLSPNDYGLVAMATSVMILLNLLKDFGLTSALVQAETLEVDQLDGVFWVNLAFAVGCAFLGIIVAEPVAVFYGEPKVREIIFALAAGVVISSSMATHAALLRRRLNFVPLMWAEVSGQIVSLIVGVSIAWLTGSYWAIVASTLSAAFATAFVTFLGMPWLPGKPRSLKSAYKLIAFGANLSVFSFLNYFSNQLGMIVVGNSVGAAAAGQFNRAQQLLNLSGNTLMQPIGQVVLPALSRLQNSADEYRATYLAILRRTSFGFTLIGAAIVLEGELMARILLGPAWGEAGHMFRWFGLTVIAVGMASHAGNVLMSQYRVSELRNWGFGDAFIRAGSSVLGLQWGAVGVAAAYSAATLFLTVPIVICIIGRKGPVGITDQFAAIRPGIFLGATAISAGLLVREWFIPDLSWISVFPSAAIVIFCAVLVMIIDPGGRLILADIQNMLRPKRSRS